MWGQAQKGEGEEWAQPWRRRSCWAGSSSLLSYPDASPSQESEAWTGCPRLLPILGTEARQGQQPQSTRVGRHSPCPGLPGSQGSRCLAGSHLQPPAPLRQQAAPRRWENWAEPHLPACLARAGPLSLSPETKGLLSAPAPEASQLSTKQSFPCGNRSLLSTSDLEGQVDTRRPSPVPHRQTGVGMCHYVYLPQGRCYGTAGETAACSSCVGMLVRNLIALPPSQLSAYARGRDSLAVPVADADGDAGPWLWPDPDLTVVAFWGLNKQMEDLLGLSLSLYLSNK